MRMKDLSPEDRPREKLRLQGAKALTNTELLAILIGSGTGGKNVTQVAQELLSFAEGRLSLLSIMPLERLVRQKGVGEVRAITICAALELGKRAYNEQNTLNQRAVNSPELVFQLMYPALRNLDHEECWVLFLNRYNYLIGKELISTGNMESTVIDTQRILRRGIEKQCRHVILVHNHPNGSALPSAADIRLTDLLRSALSAVEIDLADHVIVAEGQFFSFSGEQVVKVG